MAAVVGRGMAAAGKGGSAAAWAEHCGWIGCGLGLGLCGWLVVWCVCWRRDGALVGDLTCDAGAPARAAVGSWLVMCAACTRPLSDFLFFWALFRDGACLLRGGGEAWRDAPWLP